LITGGTTGIGLAAARLFHAEGARVFITGRTEKTLAEARQQLPADVIALRSDASNLADIDALVALLGSKADRIDIAFINAGIAKFLPFETITPEIFDEMFDINIRGASSLSRSCCRCCAKAARSCSRPRSPRIWGLLRPVLMVRPRRRSPRSRAPCRTNWPRAGFA